MAKKKSRLKKILKKLGKVALLGGAAYGASKLFGGRNKGNVLKTAASEDANIGVTHPALTDSAPVIRKDVLPAPAGTDSRFDTRFSKPGEEIISKGVRSRNLAANAAKNAAMNYQRSQTFDARPRPTAIQTQGRNFTYKKGGRVTGIAKRGFGRALGRGKK